MNSFVARQPIFDAKENVYAYELLYRQNSLSNVYDNSVNADEASSKVVVDTFLDIGIDKITGGRRAFVNFTENLLLNESATLFPKELLVVEILENIEPTPEILEKCKKLRQQGYLLALDDFIFDPKFIPLIKVADIIKIDFLATDEATIQKVRNSIVNTKIKLLAEKVETKEVFEQALRMGFTYFQGYFFSKPVIMSGHAISPLKMNFFRIIQLLHTESLNFTALGEIISQDVALTYKLLRLVNSAAFGVRQKIGQVHQALVFLGENEIRKWVSLIAMIGLSADSPEEVMILSLTRAKLAEVLAPFFHLPNDKENLFVTGLFSLMDTLMNQPIDFILKDISLNNYIKEALIESKGPYYPVLDFVRDYEKGEWAAVNDYIEKYELPQELIQDAYLETLEWARIFDEL